MLHAFGIGLLAQLSLLLAGLLVCWVTVRPKIVGILGGFGAGAMIAAVSFDLLPEAEGHIEKWQTGLWMMIGVVVFLVADKFVENRFGSEEPAVRWASSSVPSWTACRSPRSSASRSARASRSASASSRPCSSRTSRRRSHRRPTSPPAGGDRAGSVACGCSSCSPAPAAAALGYLATDVAPAVQGDRAAALAVGGLLAMLTNSLIPFSFERGGAQAGAATALGFCLSVLNS